MAAVLRAEPDESILPASTPPAIRQVLRRCLEKDRSAVSPTSPTRDWTSRTRSAKPGSRTPSPNSTVGGNGSNAHAGSSDMRPPLQFENNGGGSKAQILLRQAGCSLHTEGSELLPATVLERTRRTMACTIRIDPAEVPTMATLSRRSSMSSTFRSPRKAPSDYGVARRKEPPKSN